MMHQDVLKYLIIFVSVLFYFERNFTFAYANIKIYLGQVTSEELLSSQANGTLIVDIRRQDEWIKTGIIEGANTIMAFKKMVKYIQSLKKPIRLSSLKINTYSSLLPNRK